MKVIQYTPWIDCSTNCRFCTNRGCPDIDKIESLKQIIHLLDLPEVKEHEGIGLIGGEFFQDQLKDEIVRDLWYELTDKIVDRNPHQFWLATSLICKRTYLEPYLNYLRESNLLSRTLLCTSYDVMYRFKKTALSIWESNMRYLHLNYPELRIHTEMIVTQAFLSAVAKAEGVKLPYMIDVPPLSLKSFENIYHTSVDFIEPHTGFQNISEFRNDLPYFLPKRATFLEFLTRIVDKWDLFRIKSFLNPRIRSATIYHIQNGKLVKIEDRWNKRLEDQAVGIHPLVGYSDSSIPMLDDVELWKEKYD